MPLAAGQKVVLDLRGVAFTGIHGLQALQEILHRRPLDIARRTEGLGRLHEIREILHGKARQMIQQRMLL